MKRLPLLTRLLLPLACVAATALVSCAPQQPELDVILRNGTVYDGSGEPPRTADVGIEGDRIVEIGDLDATGPRRSKSTWRASPWPPASSTC